MYKEQKPTSVYIICQGGVPSLLCYYNRNIFIYGLLISSYVCYVQVSGPFVWIPVVLAFIEVSSHKCDKSNKTKNYKST